MTDAPSTILEEYDSKRSLYESYAEKLRALIADVLAERSITVHSVTARVKSRDSLRRKLAKPTGNYKHLSDVTDLAGIRITTYLADDVDRIAEVLEVEFAIDRTNSVDKRATLDPDQFGYLSLHHVVELNTERLGLTEYRRFPGLKAEIQTRSILQHAWAEIEHDLGYKAGDIPKPIRRRFSRLAGLLELADQEFCSIRGELSTYERVVAEQVASQPDSVPIDKVSLEAFVNQSVLIRRVDSVIANITGEEVVSELGYFFASEHPKLLPIFGITTIGELHTALAENQDTIVRFAQGWLNEADSESADEDEDERENDLRGVSPGISLFYLLYVLAARTESVERVREYLERARIETDSDLDALAGRVIAQYHRAAHSA